MELISKEEIIDAIEEYEYMTYKNGQVIITMPQEYEGITIDEINDFSADEGEDNVYAILKELVKDIMPEYYASPYNTRIKEDFIKEVAARLEADQIKEDDKYK